MKKNKGYNDVYFRLIVALIAAHLIVVYGEDESVFKLMLLWDYWRSLILSFIIAFLLVTVVNWVTTKLDRRFDWKVHPIQRTGLQILAALFLPSLIAYFLAYFYFKAYEIDIAVTRYLQFDFPVIVILLLLLNVYYLAFYFYLQWQNAEAKVPVNDGNLSLDIKRTRQEPKEVYMVQKGAKSVPIPVDTISYFYHEGDFNFLRTLNKEDFLISGTLDDVQKKLNEKQFFRANRQIVVNFSACEHIEPFENKKLKLFVQPPTKEPVVISHRRASSFKSWIDR